MAEVCLGAKIGKICAGKANNSIKRKRAVRAGKVDRAKGDLMQLRGS